MIEIICVNLVITAGMILFIRESVMKSKRALMAAKRSELKLAKALSDIVGVNNANVRTIANLEARMNDFKNELASVKMKGFIK